MSSNLDLVRSVYADWERGDFSRTAEWARPDMEWVAVDGLSPGQLTGLESMATGWRAFLEDWDDFRARADEYCELDGERILALHRFFGRGKTSGIEVGQTGSEGACVFYVRDGAVTKLLLYSARENAFNDLDIAPDTGT